MQNRLLIFLLICYSGIMSMSAHPENERVIKPMKATSMDYVDLLKYNGYEVFPFDINSFTDSQYNITFKIKEYKNGSEVGSDLLEGFDTYNNMILLSQFSEESKKKVKPEDMADSKRGIFSLAERIMIGFLPVENDSIRPMMLKVENIGSRFVRLPLYPQFSDNDSINGTKLYMYNTRPFKVGELNTGQFVPLVLLGSAWYDTNFGIHRFCGENVIDPDFSTGILQNIPHYYVIGVEINPVQKL